MNTRFALVTLASCSLGLLACGSGGNASGSDAGSDSATVGAEASADSSADSSTFTATGPMNVDSCPVVVNRANCDKNQRPIVFVHGTYSSGTDISHMAALLGSNGFCQDRIVAIDYDSVTASATISAGGVDSPGMDCTGPNTPSGCGMIDNAITAILSRPDVVDANGHPFTQVDLAGHSQGTFHCGNYLMNHADRVAHYLNFSGVPVVGATQTLSLSSLRDLFGSPHHAIGNSTCAFQQLADGGFEAVVPEGGAPTPEAGSTEGGADDAGAGDAGAGDGGAGCNVTQVTFIHQDHFAVAASKDSFVQVYKYLTGKDPMYTDIQCGDDPVMVEGIAEHFADNEPIGGMVKIREVTSTPRDTTGATMTIMGTLDGGSDGGAPPGHFGPVMLKRNTQYVFEGYDGAGNLVGWQYFTPFKRDHHLIRLLSPASGTDGSGAIGTLVASQSTDKAVTSVGTTVIVARWAQGGFRQDLGASLKINGTEVLSSDNSGLNAAMNMSLQGGVAALFLEDANKNGKTDLGLPAYTTFIAFTDVFMSAANPGFIDMSFTAGSEDPVTMSVPAVVENWPSLPSADAGKDQNHFVAMMFQ